ncbi:sensor histidine kinase [Haloarcula sp. S1AR25-5A]|uniref:histidine kinase n=1 Tax=Haloarcula terrestris TaxID=2950533 RepID=A0AAE4JIG5_9EURY|nr:sensor histidine kinase [Haloarcula terrestris]MDS0223717.1 sensor histidine kinase [Haloarcula terrestris]
MDGESDEHTESDVAQDGGLEAAIGRRFLPKSVRRRYAAKFLLSMLLVVVIIASVGVLSFVQIQTIIENDAEETLRSTATLQADSISEWLDGMRIRTRAVASSDVYAGGNTDRIHTYLQESKEMGGGDLVGIHYIDPESDTIVTSTNNRYVGRHQTAISPAVSEPISEAANGTETVASSQSAYSRTGDIHMAFASQVRGDHGVIVVVGDVARDFEQLHKSRSVVRTEVLDTDGRTVLSPRQDYTSELAGTTAFNQAVAGQTTIAEQGDNVIGIAPVPDTNWVVTTTAPRAELYQASSTVGRNVIILISVSLVSLSVISVILGRQTVLPLVRLRERAQEMESGNLDVDLSTEREDEIGRLFVSFGNMRDALRDQIYEAESARAEAEASRQNLARQNKRLDNFASTVSHDLRNPLTVARGNLELLKDRINSIGDSQNSSDISACENFLNNIDRAHERIDTIIDDVLTLARDGQHIGDKTPVDLKTVAEDAWSTVDTAEATLTVLDTRTVAADQERLRRLLENLFRNAIDHVGPETTVTVGLTADGFYVTDDGPGIPPEEVDDIFEYGHTTSETGTGLGLSIVKTIVEAHGWQLSLASEDDTGAKFVFSDVFEESSAT